MHDIKALRETPDIYDAGWARRGLEPRTAEILAMDSDLRVARTSRMEAEAARNAASKDIGKAKAEKDEATAAKLMQVVAMARDAIARATLDETNADRALTALLSALPNLPAAEVPDGADETGNVEVRRQGAPPALDFAPKDHVALGEGLGMMDFEAAAAMSGARFVVLKGPLARLERALGQFMLDVQTGEHGYTEVNPPLLVRDHAMYGTGQLPKFHDDQFRVIAGEQDAIKERAARATDIVVRAEIERTLAHIELMMQQGYAPQVLRDALKGHAEGLAGTLQKVAPERAVDTVFRSFTDGHWLIPTAEVSLTNLVREQILEEETLPRRYTALTPCFRAEAGSAGRDTRGMIRQHQFWKTELVSITTPEQSDAELDRMVACAEAILEKLGLPFRTMALCAGDMGFSARRTFDLEVWLPGQGAYREISSCSNCGDFQARRMNTRTRPKGAKDTRFVHTLNGSGLAVGRTLVAVMENYQNADGTIRVPQALGPYMGGMTQIG